MENSQKNTRQHVQTALSTHSLSTSAQLFQALKEAGLGTEKLDTNTAMEMLALNNLIEVAGHVFDLGETWTAEQKKTLKVHPSEDGTTTEVEAEHDLQMNMGQLTAAVVKVINDSNIAGFKDPELTQLFNEQQKPELKRQKKYHQKIGSMIESMKDDRVMWDEQANNPQPFVTSNTTGSAYKEKNTALMREESSGHIDEITQRETPQVTLSPEQQVEWDKVRIANIINSEMGNKEIKLNELLTNVDILYPNTANNPVIHEKKEAYRTLLTIEINRGKNDTPYPLPDWVALTDPTHQKWYQEEDQIARYQNGVMLSSQKLKHPVPGMRNFMTSETLVNEKRVSMSLRQGTLANDLKISKLNEQGKKLSKDDIKTKKQRAKTENNRLAVQNAKQLIDTQRALAYDAWKDKNPEEARDQGKRNDQWKKITTNTKVALSVLNSPKPFNRKFLGKKLSKEFFIHEQMQHIQTELSKDDQYKGALLVNNTPFDMYRLVTPTDYSAAESIIATAKNDMKENIHLGIDKRRSGTDSAIDVSIREQSAANNRIIALEKAIETAKTTGSTDINVPKFLGDNAKGGKKWLGYLGALVALSVMNVVRIIPITMAKVLANKKYKHANWTVGFSDKNPSLDVIVAQDRLLRHMQNNHPETDTAAITSSNFCKSGKDRTGIAGAMLTADALLEKQYPNDWDASKPLLQQLSELKSKNKPIFEKFMGTFKEQNAGYHTQILTALAGGSAGALGVKGFAKTAQTSLLNESFNLTLPEAKFNKLKSKMEQAIGKIKTASNTRGSKATQNMRGTELMGLKSFSHSNNLNSGAAEAAATGAKSPPEKARVVEAEAKNEGERAAAEPEKKSASREKMPRPVELKMQKKPEPEKPVSRSSSRRRSSSRSG